MSYLKEIITTLDRVKELAVLEGLDPDQISGFYGEAVAKQVIKEKIDNEYKPAPPREDNIDGTGKLGTYSVKFLTPRMELTKSRERNIIKLHRDLNFDFLVIVCDTGEVFNVPREMIINSSEASLVERRERNMINWMTCGDTSKVAIRPTNDNWNTLINNYLVCKL